MAPYARLDDDRPTVLNYGGGIQTVAMCLLVLDGVLPQPDWIVIADTGREIQSTWDYLETHVQPLLSDVGLRVHIAPHTLARVDLYPTSGSSPLVPAYTRTGMLRNWCSGEWKRAVVQRWLREQGERRAVQWIGYTLDERRRLPTHPDTGPWIRAFPLVDLMLTRADCEQIIRAHGLPLPAKSACYMCPYRSNEEWRHVRDRYPDQWADAIRIGEEIRDNDERGGLWLHHSRGPLAEANIDANDRREPVRQCGLGVCFV